MIIHLSERIFNKLFLVEGISDVTYHYCSIDSLYNMLKDGDIKLTMSSNNSDAYHKTKLFYLSTQRSKSNRIGYAGNRKSDCRIELDGYQLKADGYEGMPIDYWGASMGKQSDIGLNSPRLNIQYGNELSNIDRELILKSQGKSSNFEFEDRIFSDKPSLSFKYVKRVDCLVNNIAPVDKAIINLAKNNGVSIFFYDNEKDFILQTKNVINQKIIASTEEFVETQEGRDDEYRERSLIEFTAKLLAMLFFSKPHYNKEDYARIDTETMQVLSKFGLEKFYEQVIEKIPEKLHWVEESCISMSNDLRRLNTDTFRKTKLSNNVMLLGQYVLNSYGVNNFISLKKYFYDANRKTNKEENNVIQDSVKCVMVSYDYNWNGKWDVVLGDTSFWKYFYKDQFYNEITRQLDDDEWNQQFGETPVIVHKSKNNESFKKYIQHIMHNDNLTLYDGSIILSKIYNGNWEKMGEAFGIIVKPINITRDNFFNYESKMNLSDIIDIENKLFLNSEDSWNYRNSWNNENQKGIN